MGKQKYFWQGEAVKTNFGVAYIKENKEKPMYWYNYEFSIDETMIPAIKVTTKEGSSFIIANHFGIGVNKLSKGGYPNQAHFSLPVDIKFEGTEDLGIVRNLYSIRTFDEEAYAEHESNRRKWRKKNFPEEFEKMENLRNSLIK